MTGIYVGVHPLKFLLSLKVMPLNLTHFSCYLLGHGLPNFHVLYPFLIYCLLHVCHHFLQLILFGIELTLKFVNLVEHFLLICLLLRYEVLKGLCLLFQLLIYTSFLIFYLFINRFLTFLYFTINFFKFGFENSCQLVFINSILGCLCACKDLLEWIVVALFPIAIITKEAIISWSCHSQHLWPFLARCFRLFDLRWTLLRLLAPL